MQTIAMRVAEVRRNIEDAAKKSGRDPREVLLLAASKTRGAAEIREAFAAGVDAAGENRAQEFRDKAPMLSGFPYHFIGRLQSNKLKYLVGQTPLLHSVDSPALLEEINRLAAQRQVVQELLCQVNIARESTKGGVPPEELRPLLSRAGSLPHLRVRGLMCIPPWETVENLSNLFFKMRKLYVDIRNENMDNINMDILSMGMSGDYALAVEHGATLVRVGSAIFGARQEAPTIRIEDEGL